MSDYLNTICRLIDYEIWCNLRVVEFLEGRSEGERHRDFGFGLRTPHRTIFHVADVMQSWSRCVGPKLLGPSWLRYDEAITLQEIKTTLVDAGEAWLAATRASHEQGLLDKEHRLNHVFHLSTHGSHHRGQLLSMVTLMGYPQPFEGGDFGGWSHAG